MSNENELTDLFSKTLTLAEYNTCLPRKSSTAILFFSLGTGQGEDNIDEEIDGIFSAPANRSDANRPSLSCPLTSSQESRLSLGSSLTNEDEAGLINSLPVVAEYAYPPGLDKNLQALCHLLNQIYSTGNWYIQAQQDGFNIVSPIKELTPIYNHIFPGTCIEYHHHTVIINPLPLMQQWQRDLEGIMRKLELEEDYTPPNKYLPRF